MVRFSLLYGALAMLSAVGLGSAARAGGLPASFGYVQCDTSAGFMTGSASCAGAFDSGAVAYAPTPGLQAQALGQGLVDVAGVFGVLNYSLEVVGPAGGDVPIDVATSLTAVPISIGYAFSEIDLSADTSTFVTICSSSCGPETGVTSFSGTLQVEATPDTVYTNAVHLEIEVGGALGGVSDVDGATASADPLIYVDPGFADASDYTILLSPGIGNGGVPEPAAWAMMLTGFGAVGALIRRRRERRAAA